MAFMIYIFTKKSKDMTREELQQKLLEIKADKNIAIKNQDYQAAVILRDQEIKITEEIQKLEKNED